MDVPSSHAMLSTLPHPKVRYTPSTNTVKYQGMESTHLTRMAHTCSSLISSFRYKTPMTTLSATSLWAHHIKALLTTCYLSLQGLQLWPHLPAVHQQLLLLRHPNPHTLFHKIRIHSNINLLYPSLHTFTVYLRLQPRFHPLNPAMKTSKKISITPFHPHSQSGSRGRYQYSSYPPFINTSTM